ncbi:MAG: YceI family protein [Rhodothermales bacterium]
MRRTLFRIVPTLLVGILLTGFAAHRTEAPDRPTKPPTSERAVFEIDKAHSMVGFKVRHLGLSNVTGTFSDYMARVELDPTDLSSMSVAARINVASVDTGNERRDADLRSDNFFDAAQHPQIRFQSTGVTDIDGNMFKLAGDLTIRGVTKSVVLDGELIGVATGPMGKQRVGIEARTTIDRRDFGLTWNRLTEAGGVIVGHDVTILLDIQAVHS